MYKHDLKNYVILTFVAKHYNFYTFTLIETVHNVFVFISRVLFKLKDNKFDKFADFNSASNCTNPTSQRWRIVKLLLRT